MVIIMCLTGLVAYLQKSCDPGMKIEARVVALATRKEHYELGLLCGTLQKSGYRVTLSRSLGCGVQYSTGCGRGGLSTQSTVFLWRGE